MKDQIDKDMRRVYMRGANVRGRLLAAASTDGFLSLVGTSSGRVVRDQDLGPSPEDLDVYFDEVNELTRPPSVLPRDRSGCRTPSKRSSCSLRCVAQAGTVAWIIPASSSS